MTPASIRISLIWWLDADKSRHFPGICSVISSGHCIQNSFPLHNKLFVWFPVGSPQISPLPKLLTPLKQSIFVSNVESPAPSSLTTTLVSWKFALQLQTFDFKSHCNLLSWKREQSLLLTQFIPWYATNRFLKKKHIINRKYHHFHKKFCQLPPWNLACIHTYRCPCCIEYFLKNYIVFYVRHKVQHSSSTKRLMEEPLYIIHL